MSGFSGSIPIEIVSAPLTWDGTNTAYKAARVWLDPAEWDGVVGARIEASIQIDINTPPFGQTQETEILNLVDENGKIHATASFTRPDGLPTVPFTNVPYTLSLSAAWSFTEAHWYTFQLVDPQYLDVNINSNLASLYEGRIWLDLSNSNKLMVQRPMTIGGSSEGGSEGTPESNDTFAWTIFKFQDEPGYGYDEGNGEDTHSLWKYDSSAFATIAGYRFAVTGWIMVYQQPFDASSQIRVGSMWVSLFDKTADSQVAITELEWPYADQEVIVDAQGFRAAVPLPQYVDFTSAQANFVSGHEYEVRLKTTASTGLAPTAGDYGLSAVSRADLWIKVAPVTKFEIYLQAIHLNEADLTINSIPGFPTGSTYSFETSKRKVTGTSPTYGISDLGGSTLTRATGATKRTITGIYYGGYAGHQNIVNANSHWRDPADFLAGPSWEQYGGLAGWHLPGSGPIVLVDQPVDTDGNGINIGTLFEWLDSATAGVAYWGPILNASPPSPPTTAEVTLSGFEFFGTIAPAEVITKVSLVFSWGWGKARPSSTFTSWQDITAAANAVVGGTSLASHSVSVSPQPYIIRYQGTPYFGAYPLSDTIQSFDITSDRAWTYADFTRDQFKVHVALTNPMAQWSTGPAVLFELAHAHNTYADNTPPLVVQHPPSVVVEVSQACPTFVTITNTSRTITRTPINLTTGINNSICYNTGQFVIGFIVINPVLTSTISLTCPPTDPVDGVFYSYTFTPTGGTSPFVWERIAGSFPPGLTFSSANGTLSGIPTNMNGSWQFTVKVTDKNGQTATVTCEFAGKCIPKEVKTTLRGKWTINSRVGPFENCGPEIVGIFVDPDDATVLLAQYSTDYGVTWLEVPNAVGATILSHDAHQIHNDPEIVVATQTADGAVKYHAFDIPTGLWTVTNEGVASATTTIKAVSIAKRTSGNPVIFYQSNEEVIDTVTYQRTAYQERISGSWGGEIVLADNGEPENNIIARAIPGVDRVMFISTIVPGYVTTTNPDTQIPNSLFIPAVGAEQKLQILLADNSLSDPFVNEISGDLSESSPFNVGDYTTYVTTEGATIFAVPIKKDGRGWVYFWTDADAPVDAFDKFELPDFVVESPDSQFPKVTVRYIGGEFHAIDWFAKNFDDKTWLRYRHGTSPGGTITGDGTFGSAIELQFGPVMDRVTKVSREMGATVTRRFGETLQTYVASFVGLGTVDGINGTIKFDWINQTELPSDPDFTLDVWLTEQTTEETTLVFDCPPKGLSVCPEEREPTTTPENTTITPPPAETATSATLNIAARDLVSTARRDFFLPDRISSEIRPDEGASSIQRVRVTFPDIGQRFTRLLANDVTLRGRVCTLKAGYDNMPESDFVTIFTGIFDQLQMAANNIAYDADIRDPDVFLNKDIFLLASTTLTDDIGAGDTAIGVNDATDFQLNADPILMPGYARIGDEIIAFSSKGTAGPASGSTGLNFGEINALTGIQRGQVGTTPVEHKAGDTVNEIYFIGPMHPMDLAISVITHPLGGAVDISHVDVPAFMQARTEIGDDVRVIFIIQGPANLKQWLETEIYKPFSCYPFTKGDGTISIKHFKIPNSINDVTATIDESVMIGTPSFDKGFDRMINAVTYYFDEDPLTQKFGQSVTFIDDTSITRYGELRPMVIESRGIRSTFRFSTTPAGTDNQAQGSTGLNFGVTTVSNQGDITMEMLRSQAKQRLERYSNGAPLVQVVTFLQKVIYEVGDVIKLSSTVIPNGFTGTRGITNDLYEIVNREIQIREGRVVFTLMSVGTAVPSIAVEDARDFGFVSQQSQSKTFFISDANGKNPDGTNGNTIQ